MLPEHIYIHHIYFAFMLMETFKINKACIIFSLLIFLSCFFPVQALSPAGTIQRTTKLQLLASLPPSHKTTPTSGSFQLFLTSPSGKYSAFLLRQETSTVAGGFDNDFCYIQVQEGGRNVWQSEYASISSVDTCSLVFSDAGLEIFDGSKSAWNTGADGKHLKSLVLLSAGDMHIVDQDGKLVWKASDNPMVNQNCGSIGGSGFSSALPPFAAPINKEKSPFGQSLDNQDQQSQLGYQQQQELGYPQQGLNQPFSSFNQPFSSLNQPSGFNNQQLDNTPFDSGVSGEKTFNLGVVLISLVTLMAAFGFLV